MKHAISIVALIAFVGVGFLAHAESKPEDVLGVWYTDGKGSKIEIYKEADKFNGKIVWLKNPNYGDDDPEAGKPQRDRNNPDTARQNDPLVGLNLIKGFTFDGTENWSDGTIYDPESGKTYKCTMKLTDENTLDVHGYIGIPAFGRSTVWTRVPKDEGKEEAKPEEAAQSDAKQ